MHPLILKTAFPREQYLSWNFFFFLSFSYSSFFLPPPPPLPFHSLFLDAPSGIGSLFPAARRTRFCNSSKVLPSPHSHLYVFLIFVTQENYFPPPQLLKKLINLPSGRSANGRVEICRVLLSPMVASLKLPLCYFHI